MKPREMCNTETWRVSLRAAYISTGIAISPSAFSTAWSILEQRATLVTYRAAYLVPR